MPHRKAPDPNKAWARAQAAADRRRWEDLLALHIRTFRLTEPTKELRFCEGKGWRFDFAWPEFKLAVEIEGVTWQGGRHQRKEGFEADAEKYRVAGDLGWKLLRFTPLQVKSGDAIRSIQIELTRITGVRA